MKHGRMTKNQENQIYKFVADLLVNRKSEVVNVSGRYSPQKICDLIMGELGLKYSTTSVAVLLKKDVTKYQDTKPAMNEDIRDINKNLNMLDSIMNDPLAKSADKIKASQAYSGLMKTKLQYEQAISDSDIRKAETLKPVYDVKFGHYRAVRMTCPKCKHVFNDIPGKEKKDDVKSDEQLQFKSGNGQSTLEKSTEKKDGDKDDK